MTLELLGIPGLWPSSPFLPNLAAISSEHCSSCVRRSARLGLSSNRATEIDTATCEGSPRSRVFLRFLARRISEEPFFCYAFPKKCTTVLCKVLLIGRTSWSDIPLCRILFFFSLFEKFPRAYCAKLITFGVAWRKRRWFIQCCGTKCPLEFRWFRGNYFDVE